MNLITRRLRAVLLAIVRHLCLVTEPNDCLRVQPRRSKTENKNWAFWTRRKRTTSVSIGTQTYIHAHIHARIQAHKCLDVLCENALDVEWRIFCLRECKKCDDIALIFYSNNLIIIIIIIHYVLALRLFSNNNNLCFTIVMVSEADKTKKIT